MSVLAQIKPFFKYSMDLNSQFPVIAYYLKFYAVTKGFDLIKAAPAGSNVTDQKTFLKGELSELEKMFSTLPGGSKEDHKYQVENFVLSVFAKVDKDERTCEKVTKTNAMDFKRCSDFIVMMSLFGQLEPEW
jgi:vacuolar protein sorting-associated protein VTA1